MESELAEQSVPPHMNNQQNFARMRQGPSASPPMGNGAMPYHRQRTPQPGMGSRPSSRNHNPIPRPNSTLNQVTHAPPMANGYAYMANHGVYNPHAPPGMPGGPQHGPQHPQQSQPQYQQFNRMHQMPQQYMQDQRRGSMPQFAQNDRLQPQPQLKTERHSASPPQQQQELEPQNNNLQPQQPKPLGSKARSIFTPIDDRGSLLAQHWGLGSTSNESQQQEPPKSDLISQDKDRSQSVDVAAVHRSNISQSTTGPTKPPQPQRVFSQPQRTQSVTSISGDGKRPRLKVQIPSEQSDDGASAGDSSSPQANQGANRNSNSRTNGAAVLSSGETPVKADPSNHSSSTNSNSGGGSGVVLPPPSPSASAILSAGAQGPPNPFARPLPPGANGSNGNNNSNSGPQTNNASAYASNSNIETPISALPSRFLQDGMLPSPSSFYPEWGFGRSSDSNVLPSPLNFTTPVAGSGPSFGGSGAGKESEGGLKRKSPEQDVGRGDAGVGKRIKAES